MHLVTRLHFRSRDKDGGHNIRSRRSRKPHPRSFTLRELSTFWLLWTSPRPDGLHIGLRSEPVSPGDILDVRKWTSHINAVESYRTKGDECVNLVARGYLRPCDKDGGHIIRCAVVENPTIHANLMALSVIEAEWWTLEVLHCGNRNVRLFGSCDLDLDPMTFIRTWPVLPGDTPDVQQLWTSYVNDVESYRLTDIQTDRQVTRGHFRSRDEDGGQTIRSAIVEKPMLHAGLTALSFIERDGQSKFTFREWTFSPSMTLTFTRWPSYSLRTWSVLPGCIPDVQIWTSYVKAFESYRLTDRQSCIHTYRQSPPGLPVFENAKSPRQRKNFRKFPFGRTLHFAR